MRFYAGHPVKAPDDKKIGALCVIALAILNQEKFCLAMRDIDHFKRSNDSHGHAAGDALLHEVAKSILCSIRGEDFACRMGGEEFLLRFGDPHASEALQIAQRVREAIRCKPSEAEG